MQLGNEREPCPAAMEVTAGGRADYERPILLASPPRLHFVLGLRLWHW